MIRNARIEDAKTIHQMLNTFSERGAVLPRSLSEIYDHLRDYSVYCHGGAETIIGTCAIHVCWGDLAEIRSLAVSNGFAGRGIGSAMVEHCITQARELGIHRVFALTYSTGFFEKMGFYAVDKASLPHKIWADCLKCAKFPDCDEVAMIREI